MLAGHDEIVALKFNTLIIFDREECIERLNKGEDFTLISRAMMHLMSNADLGMHWDRASEAPTLFLRSQVESQ